MPVHPEKQAVVPSTTKQRSFVWRRKAVAFFDASTRKCGLIYFKCLETVSWKVEGYFIRLIEYSEFLGLNCCSQINAHAFSNTLKVFVGVQVGFRSNICNYKLKVYRGFSIVY